MVHGLTSVLGPAPVNHTLAEWHPDGKIVAKGKLIDGRGLFHSP